MRRGVIRRLAGDTLLSVRRAAMRVTAGLHETPLPRHADSAFLRFTNRPGRVCG